MKTLLALLTIVLLIGLPPASRAQDASDACLEMAPRFDTTVRLGRGDISDLALSPDGTQVAVASGTGLWLYDATTLQNPIQLKAPIVATDEVPPPDGYVPTTVAWSPDGKQIAAGYYDGVRIWEVGTGQVTYHLPIVPQVTHVAWSPNGANLAIISLAEVSQFPDATPYSDIYVFELTGRVLNRLASHIIRNADQAVWSPDGTQLLYITSYAYQPAQQMTDYVPVLGAAVVWNSADGSLTTLTPTDGYFDVTQVAWSGSTWALAVDTDEIGAGNEVQLWDMASRSMTASLPYVANQLAGATDTLMIVENSALVLVKGDVTTTLPIETGVRTATLNADASRVLVSTYTDLAVIDTASQQVVASNGEHSGFSMFPAWSADGQYVALIQRNAVSDARLVYIYDTQGQRIHQFPLDGGATALAWSPDGSMLAAALYGDRVDLITVADGSVTSLSVENPNGLAWSPDSQQLASINEAGSVSVYDRASAISQTFPSPIENLEGTAANLNNRLAWTTAGLRWVLSDWESVFRVYGPNFDTGETLTLGEIGFLKAISLGTAPEILPDGSVIYIPYEGDVTVFDTTAGALSASYPKAGQEVRWSNGGACYGAVNGGYVTLYDTAQTTELNFLALPVEAEWGLYGGTFWSPDGKHVLIELRDGSALIWGMGT